MYFEVLGNSVELSNIDEEKSRLTKMREEFEREFMKLCYKVLGVEFPDRGFLLFWQSNNTFVTEAIIAFFADLNILSKGIRFD